MSHVARYKTEIKNPNRKVLMAAGNALAQKTSGTFIMGGQFDDYYGKKTKAQFVLKTPGFDRGIGINIEHGQMSIVCDDYGHKEEVDKLKKFIQQYYSVAAAIDALKQMGYGVQIKEQNDVIQVHGVIG